MTKMLQFFGEWFIIPPSIMPTTIKKHRSPLLQLLKDNSAALTVVKENEILEATYLGKNGRAAYFDLGRLGTGILRGLELLNARADLKDLAIGKKALVKVVESESDDGYVELSLRETHKQKAWEKVKELQESEEVITVTILSANAGGLVGEIEKLSAFLPVSHLSTEHYPQVNDGDKARILEELKKLVGQSLEVKIISADPRTNKLIVSEKAIVAADIKERLAEYKVGDIVDGIITGVADFGAFVKFINDPGIEGLIHISELDHRLVDNPKEVVKVDDMVKAQITEIKDDRVSLSLKALKPNPWDGVDNKYKIGQEVEGTVSRFNPFGAFISLDLDIQGLVHVSTFGGVEEMKKQLVVGEKYQFVIELIKPEEKRIVLKLKTYANTTEEK